MNNFVKKQMMHHAFTWKALETVGLDGSRTYAEPQEHKGYFVPKLQWVTNTQGDKVISKTQLFIPDPLANDIKPGDMIVSTLLRIDSVVIARDLYFKEKGALDYGVIYL